jgi:hypothetical protein
VKAAYDRTSKRWLYMTIAPPALRGNLLASKTVRRAVEVSRRF